MARGEKNAPIYNKKVDQELQYNQKKVKENKEWLEQVDQCMEAAKVTLSPECQQQVKSIISSKNPEELRKTLSPGYQEAIKIMFSPNSDVIKIELSRKFKKKTDLEVIASPEYREVIEKSLLSPEHEKEVKIFKQSSKELQEVLSSTDESSLKLERIKEIKKNTAKQLKINKPVPTKRSKTITRLFKTLFQRVKAIVSKQHPSNYIKKDIKLSNDPSKSFKQGTHKTEVKIIEGNQLADQAVKGIMTQPIGGSIHRNKEERIDEVPYSQLNSKDQAVAPSRGEKPLVPARPDHLKSAGKTALPPLSVASTREAIEEAKQIGEIMTSKNQKKTTEINHRLKPLIISKEGGRQGF